MDQKPPRLVADERETLLALLRYQRESMVRKLEGIDDAAARRSLVGSDTTLLWLVKHLAGAEARWVLGGFGRRQVDVDDAVRPSDTLPSVIAHYQHVWREVDEVIATASLDETCPAISGTDTVNLRWIVAHLLEETARHAGHADILRELIDGRTGR